MLARIISRIRGHFQARERGQVLVMVAGLLAVFGGMTAVAVDLGSFMADRRDHQNYADAIALAASLELPDAGAARAVADEWALKNGIAPSDMTVEIIQQSLPDEPNPKVRVEVQGEHGFTFARLIGIKSATVRASAAAIKTSAAGGDGIIPLSVTQDALLGVAYGEEVVLKYDATDIFAGNTSPIRIDGPGVGNCINSGLFCSGVKFGSETVVCAEGADPTYCDGPTTVDTQTGNIIGAINNAISYRLNETDPLCSEFTQVFEDDPTTDEPGVYRIVQECNPYLEGSYESLRVLIVPVIDQLCNGSCEVTIVDFALFFLEGFADGDCRTGIECEVVGRFVKVNQNVGLLAGTFNPQASNVFVRLVE